MSFTRQHTTTASLLPQGTGSLSFITSPLYAENWRNKSICPQTAGNRSGQFDWPGQGCCNLKTSRGTVRETLAQNYFTMKNARKQRGEMASTDATQFNPGPIVPDSVDDLQILENEIFHSKPRPRHPESPEAESFRSWLKAHTPKHSASPALLERIRKITEDFK
ncbi:MAG: hypothetical protein JNJ57_11235 [Saprospiraceae bacterium]|nr:hypothetical protein [Saprospiraceae bacterium]